ncbi:hypothetical protein [Chitinophaga sp. RAB17]|uniref:hypothetical protein n=1 Tax=Chitinophaga sp. RAB17 TaxID=3233049 RepID=UPI003F934097
MIKVSQKLYNEKLRSPSERIIRLAGFFALLFLVLGVAGFLGARKFNDDVITWIFFGLLAVYFLVKTVFDKMLVWICFDYQLQVMEITTVTLFSREKTQHIPLTEVRYKSGKEGKRFIPYIDLYNGREKIIHLSRDGIGEHTFDMIAEELTELVC